MPHPISVGYEKAHSRGAVHRWGIALGSVILTTIVAAFFNEYLAAFPYFMLYSIPVAYSAFIGGLSMGMVSTFISVLIIDVFFRPPFGFSLHLQTQDSITHLLAFGVESLFISMLVQRLHAQRQIAEETVRRHETELRELKLQQRAKDEFLALVSHELRTPATSMNGWIYLLKKGKLGQHESERALDAIERGVKSQVRMIEDLMDISRVAAGKFSLIAKPIELRMLIANTVELLRPIAASKNIALSFESEVPDFEMTGDGERLQQVVSNLVSNALKFTPAGGDVTVTLAVAGLDDAALRCARIAVKDSGVGLPVDALRHVFDRFWQGDGSTHTRAAGLGLGLALAKHIISEHGGTIRAESDGPGKGACFSVELPAHALTLNPVAQGCSSAG